MTKDIADMWASILGMGYYAKQNDQQEWIVVFEHPFGLRSFTLNDARDCFKHSLDRHMDGDL